MSERVLWNANARRDRLKSKIALYQQSLAKRQAELETVLAWIEGYYEFAGPSFSGEANTPHEEQIQNIQGPDVQGPQKAEAKLERKRATGNPKKEVVAAISREIIEEANQPVSRADLHKELKLKGVVIEGKDPEQVLSTMMWRTAEKFKIVRVSTGGYWLAERPHEESGYNPDAPKSELDDVLNTPAEEIGPPTESGVYYMTQAAEMFIEETPLDDLRAITDYYAEYKALPEPVRKSLLIIYKDCSALDYVAGSGFQDIFLEQLNEAIKTAPTEERASAT